MILKRVITVASLFALLSVWAVGQVSDGAGKQVRGPGAGNHNIHRGALGHRLAEKLNLTDQQKSELQALRAKYRSQMKALRAAPGDRNAKRAQARALVQDRMTQFKAILTPAQAKRLDSLRAKIHDARRAKGEGRKGSVRKTPPPV